MTSKEQQTAIVRKQIVKLFMLTLVFMLSSCVKEGHVCYRFDVFNATQTPMTVHLSSWGEYTVSINNMYDSTHRFQEVEIIKPGASLIFNAQVGDNPNPWEIPSSLTPAWEYIVAIECNGVTIPKAYFANYKNWELGVAPQINGTFTIINTVISSELIEQFSQKQYKSSVLSAPVEEIGKESASATR